MISRKFLPTLSLVLIWTLSTQGQGLIWSFNSGSSVGGPIGTAPLGSWQIAFDHTSDRLWSTAPSANPATRLFTMALTTNDSGHTFFANALNEPGFDGFVAGLTDGANDYIRFQSPYPSSWQVDSEQRYLGRSSLSPDLAGYNITQIGFRVNSFYDWYDGTEDRYLKTLDYSLDFYGAPVPEPSTWALLGLGGAAALLLRRKTRKQHPAPRK